MAAPMRKNVYKINKDRFNTDSAKISEKQVKEQAKQHLHHSAGELTEDAMHLMMDPDKPAVLNPRLISRAANRVRARLRPEEPKDLEFQIDQDYLQCADFLVGDIRVDTARHMIFASPEQLRLLKECRRWFMDETFKVMSPPFRPGQLMSIHGFIQRDGVDKQVPMAFVLMSRKKKEDYVAVLNKLKDAMGGEVAVEGFMLDFEPGAWLAVRYVFEGVDVRGCVFNWTQCVWRYAQDKGLKPAYSQRSSVYQFIRQLLALPFLPHNHIERTFQQLQQRANTDELRALTSYIDRQWMKHTIFDIASWCIFGSDIRTNNDVEGWHHRLNNRAGHRGLSFYKMVPVLRKEADIVPIQIRQVEEGQGRLRRPRYRRLDEKIRSLWDQSRAGTITTARLLRACAKLYGPKDGKAALPDAASV